MATGERSPQGEGGANYEPFELQPSVLEAVASLCPEHEAEEIWRIVGPSLVEQARDLLDEVRSLPVPPTANDGRIIRVFAVYGVHQLDYLLLLICRQRFTWRFGGI